MVHGARGTPAPRRCGRRATRRSALARHLDEQLQRRPGVGDDPVVGGEDPPDLGRLDVDVHELPARGIGGQAAGVPVRPPVADAEHEVRGQHRGVAVPVCGLQAGHAGHQPVVVGQRAPAHQRRHHRGAGQLGELGEQVRGVGVDDPAAGHDDRPLGLGQHVQRLSIWARVAAGLYTGSGW
jgi:hypothetical protein